MNRSKSETEAANLTPEMSVAAEHLKSRSVRLNNIIEMFFVTQIELANELGVNKTTLSRYTIGKDPITKKFALKLEKEAGINADYILNGNEPMMVDASRKPLLTAPIHHSANIDTTGKHGITKQYILQQQGLKETFRYKGESSVIDLILGDTGASSLSFQVLNNLSRFETDYNIPMSATLILNKDYDEEDFVLFIHNGRECRIGIFYKEEVVDCLTQIPYKEAEVEIKGSIIGKYEHFTLTKK